MGRLKSIHELVCERNIFEDPHISGEDIIGLCMGYLMEEAGIPDFTSKGYDYDCPENFSHCYRKLEKLIAKYELNKFFRPFNDIIIGLDYKGYTAPQKYFLREKYDAAKKIFDMPWSEFTVFPDEVYDTFLNMIDAEKDPARKAELQFMEMAMLSRVPALCKERLNHKLTQVRFNDVPARLMPTYELAMDYFL